MEPFSVRVRSNHEPLSSKTIGGSAREMIVIRICTRLFDSESISIHEPWNHCPAKQ